MMMRDVGSECSGGSFYLLFWPLLFYCILLIYCLVMLNLYWQASLSKQILWYNAIIWAKKSKRWLCFFILLIFFVIHGQDYTIWSNCCNLTVLFAAVCFCLPAVCSISGLIFACLVCDYALLSLLNSFILNCDIAHQSFLVIFHVLLVMILEIFV